MPIAEENKDRYPDYWPILSWWIRYRRAEGRCECRGECGSPHSLDGNGRCPERDKENAIHFNGPVLLTVAHLDHTPEHCDALPSGESNLKAMCQACHLRYDSGYHQSTKDERQNKLFKD